MTTWENESLDVPAWHIGTDSMPPPAVQQSSKRDLRFRLSLEALVIERYLLPIALANKSRVEGCTQTVPPLPQVGNLPAPGFTQAAAVAVPAGCPICSAIFLFISCDVGSALCVPTIHVYPY
jgi:hypothetical protein